MTSHQVKYEGPASLAVDVATLLADAQGIDLTSAEREEGTDGKARLVLTVEATPEAVTAAVGSIRTSLPGDASITVHEV